MGEDKTFSAKIQRKVGKTKTEWKKKGNSFRMKQFRFTFSRMPSHSKPSETPKPGLYAT